MYKIFSFLLISTYNISFGQSLDSIIHAYEIYQDQSYEKHKTAWPEIDEIAQEAQAKQFSKWFCNLQQINNEQLTKEEVINKDLLELVFKDKLDNIALKSYLMPLNAEGGFIINMMYQVKSATSSPKKKKQYIQKLASTPQYITSQINNLRQGLEEGITMPTLVVDNCISLLENALSKETLFLIRRVEDEVSPELEFNLRTACKQLLTFLKDEYRPNCRTAIGVLENSNGKAYYEQRIRYFTTLNMSPQTVFDTGLKEVDRIKSEMQLIIDSLGFKGSYSEFLDFLRTDKQFYVDTPEELLRHAAWITTMAQGILPKYFSRLPELPLTVTPVPMSIAPTYTTGRYSGGSMSNKKAGQYWVNTYNLPARPLYVLPALTLHEGVPGHHLQISLAGELENLPKFRKSQYLSAYGEGWGLYAEYLGKEAGMYTSLYEDFGRLTYEMWRACRLVVDPGMHYFDWSRDEALSYMANNTALSIHEVTTEIDRYIGWPGQAVSYKIGELKIRELRNLAEHQLKDQFDLRAFHDKVLENGSVPLTTLERIIVDWIKRSLNAKK